jgi:hypothetical protein
VHGIIAGQLPIGGTTAADLNDHIVAVTTPTLITIEIMSASALLRLTGGTRSQPSSGDALPHRSAGGWRSDTRPTRRGYPHAGFVTRRRDTIAQ